MTFCEFTELCNQHYSPHLGLFHRPEEIPVAPLQPLSAPHPSPRQALIHFLAAQICLSGRFRSGESHNMWSFPGAVLVPPPPDSRQEAMYVCGWKVPGCTPWGSGTRLSLSTLAVTTDPCPAPATPWSNPAPFPSALWATHSPCSRTRALLLLGAMQSLHSTYLRWCRSSLSSQPAPRY